MPRPTTITVENYLKAILALERPAAGPATPRDAFVSIGAVASALGVTPGTVTSMAQRLARDGLARYQRYAGVALTPRGRSAALAVLRRHRVIEAFLVNTLGLDWSQVHDEAERLEHAVSDRLIDRLDAFLGRPGVDPHGDPIPDAAGRAATPPLCPLAAIPAGRSVRVARILDQSEEFLRFAERSGLKPGSRLRVLRPDPASDSLTCVPRSLPPVTLSTAAAQRVLVEAVR